MFKVVAIGAAFKDIEKVRVLLRAFPSGSGSVFLFVQYPDASDDGITAEMLSADSRLLVGHVVDGAVIEEDHLYIAPAGFLMTIAGGRIRLTSMDSAPVMERPFDILARAVAAEFGPYAIAVILSAGESGRAAVAIGEVGGLVLTHDLETVDAGAARNQRPSQVGQLERPKISGLADLIVNHSPMAENTISGEPAAGHLTEIIDLLKQSVPADFSTDDYRVLQRQIGWRLDSLGLSGEAVQRYIAVLRESDEERKTLASDLLLSLAGFFWDRAAFDHLRDEVIPTILGSKMPDETFRVWVAGCRTGEEAYSLAALLLERIDRQGGGIKVQIFASDSDADAIAVARRGRYSTTAVEAVPPALLQSYFHRDENGYVVNTQLRASIVFTVQDVLVDPPFTRIDLLFCRNWLAHLQPAAQVRALGAFSFALRDNGVLLVGRSETIPGLDEHFRQAFYTQHIYRRIGDWRVGDDRHDLLLSDAGLAGDAGSGRIVPRQRTLADLVSRTLLDRYMPVSVLINRKHEYLHSTGPTSKILRFASGPASRDLFAITPKPLHNKIRSAIRHASEQHAPSAVSGAWIDIDGNSQSFSVHAEPLSHRGEEFYLLCFIEEMERVRPKASEGTETADPTYVLQLEHALAEARNELEATMRNLEIAADEQRINSAEAQSLNEAYRSANEELAAERGELQALNKDLEIRNNQLHDRLDRQNAIAGNFQNILHSIDLPMVFLDEDLNIRFFTPATRLLFNVIPTDIGRPLSDLSMLVDDAHLRADAMSARDTDMPSEKEIGARNGHWYIRRITPYRTDDGQTKGVVITFIDTSVQRKIAEDREAAKRSAELATEAKSHFLAAASHDLRQPLQTLKLLQGLLEESVDNDQARLFVKRMEDTLASMSGILNTVLDINQIEVGMVQPKPESFFVATILERLRKEFSFSALAKGLDLRVMTSSSAVHTDPRLLEQVVRNLLSNAVKYTQAGRILVGCRRRGEKIRLEVWDTGIGIPENQTADVFDEYHQLDMPAGSRGQGLGLGLSIVKRLSDLLDFNVSVCSQQNRGSVFSIEIECAALGRPLVGLSAAREVDSRRNKPVAAILVIEDEQQMRDLLSIGLEQVGHIVTATANAAEALAIIQRGKFAPDAILADFNLSQGMDGLTAIAEVRRMLGRDIPALVLTGNISSHTLRKYAQNKIPHLNKPAKLRDIIDAIDDLLAYGPDRSSPVKRTPVRNDIDDDTDKLIELIDDDQGIRDSLETLFQGTGWSVVSYASAEEYLSLYSGDRVSCLMVDAYLPSMGGLELLRILKERGHRHPVIVITGHSDVRMAVEAMRHGAVDFIEKPFSAREIQASVRQADALSRGRHQRSEEREEAQEILAQLTRRQRQILERIVAGQPNKIIAAEMEISQRTVENHRASIMRRTGSASFPALLKLVASAGE